MRQLQDNIFTWWSPGRRHVRGRKPASFPSTQSHSLQTEPETNNQNNLQWMKCSFYNVQSTKWQISKTQVSTFQIKKGEFMLNQLLWPGPVWTWPGCSWWCWCAGRGSGSSRTGRRRCWWRRCWPSWARGCRWWRCHLRCQATTRATSPVLVDRPVCAAARSLVPRVWRWLVLEGERRMLSSGCMGKDFVLVKRTVS